METVRGRFAPSPSGRMHLGNVLSAMLAWLSAKSQGGEIVLRIEDLDPARSRREYAEQIMDDFRWLGLHWDERSPDQSSRSEAYRILTERLERDDLVYPCYCSRGQIHAASAPHASDGRVIYPGTCRNLTPEQRISMKKAPAYRLKLPDGVIRFTDGLQGDYALNLQKEMGDIIIRRADGVAAYQLAVVADDGESCITEVVRGRDLLSSTPVQIYLYGLLGMKPPKFYHVPMLLAEDGRRLSKRDGDIDLGVLRKYYVPEQLIGILAYLCGLTEKPDAVSLEELVAIFDWSRISRQDIVLDRKQYFGDNL